VAAEHADTVADAVIDLDRHAAMLNQVAASL
jgi:hypothetical protein